MLYTAEAVARRRKLQIGEASVTGCVGIGPNASGGFELTVDLHVRLPELDADLAEQIVAAADRICPYSNANRGTIDVRTVVEPAAEVI